MIRQTEMPSWLHLMHPVCEQIDFYAAPLQMAGLYVRDPDVTQADSQSERIISGLLITPSLRPAAAETLLKQLHVSFKVYQPHDVLSGAALPQFEVECEGAAWCID